MKSMRHGATACVIALLTLPAVAQVTVTDPWVREKQQVKEGETVPVTLVFETAGKRELLEVKAAARTAAARNDMMKKHGH